LANVLKKVSAQHTSSLKSSDVATWEVQLSGALEQFWPTAFSLCH